MQMMTMIGEANASALIAALGLRGLPDLIAWAAPHMSACGAQAFAGVANRTAKRLAGAGEPISNVARFVEEGVKRAAARDVTGADESARPVTAAPLPSPVRASPALTRLVGGARH